MPSIGGITMSRRTLFQIGAAGSGVLLAGLIPSPAVAAADPSATAVTAEEAARRGFTDIVGMKSEYRQSIANFPLPLPDGWSFPIEPQVGSSSPGALWEMGSGRAAAYLCWLRAVASAAHDAHLRGDNSEADRLLDILEAGYNTSTRRAVIEDEDNTFLTQTVAPARSVDTTSSRTTSGGDFSLLMASLGTA